MNDNSIMTFTRNGDIRETLKIGKHSILGSELKESFNNGFLKDWPEHKIINKTDNGGGNCHKFLLWLPGPIWPRVSPNTDDDDLTTWWSNGKQEDIPIDEFIKVHKHGIKAKFEKLECKIASVSFYRQKKKLKKYGFDSGLLIEITYSDIRKK